MFTREPTNIAELSCPWTYSVDQIFGASIMVHKIIWLLLLLPAEEWKLSFLQTYMYTSPNTSSKYFANSKRLISWQRTKPQQCSVLLSNYCYTDVVEYKDIKTAEMNVVLTFQISKGELIKCIRWLSNYHFLHDLSLKQETFYYTSTFPWL